LTQFTPNRKIEHPVFLSKSGSDSPKSPDMILGHDLICKLGLDLKFNDETPATIWEDVEVPMVPHGDWTPAQMTKHLQQFLNCPLMDVADTVNELAFVESYREFIKERTGIKLIIET
jgi:hypothetical protein